MEDDDIFSSVRDNTLRTNQLDLYDFCINIDTHFVNYPGLSRLMGLSQITLFRDFKKLKGIGVLLGFENQPLLEENAEDLTFGCFILYEPIHIALRKLDNFFGMWPFSKKSQLSGFEQADVLSEYIKVLDGEQWRKKYFDETKLRKERLRVIKIGRAHV